MKIQLGKYKLEVIVKYSKEKPKCSCHKFGWGGKKHFKDCSFALIDLTGKGI
jgi:L-arabinose isomerase